MSNIIEFNKNETVLLKKEQQRKEKIKALQKMIEIITEEGFDVQVILNRKAAYMFSGQNDLSDLPEYIILSLDKNVTKDLKIDNNIKIYEITGKELFE